MATAPATNKAPTGNDNKTTHKQPVEPINSYILCERYAPLSNDINHIARPQPIQTIQKAPQKGCLIGSGEFPWMIFFQFFPNTQQQQQQQQ